MANETRPVLRRMTLLTMLTQATQMARRNFWGIFSGTAIPVVIASVLMVLPQLLNPAVRARPGETPGPEVIVFPFIMLGAVMIYGLVLGVCAMVIQAAALAAVTGRQTTLSECWRWSLQPRAIGTMFLFSFAAGLGLMCCFIPGLAILVLFGLTVPVMYCESIYGTAAMERARLLISRNPDHGLGSHPAVRLLGIGFVGYLLSYAASLAVQLPFMAVQWFIMFRSLPEQEPGAMGLPLSWVWLQIPQNMLSACATLAITIYVLFTVALLYSDVRGAREGKDLHEALDELGAPRMLGS